jgi:MFS transporter, SET family, sugar efflux transporter
LSCCYSSDRRAPLDYESDSLVARFAPDREAFGALRRTNEASLTTDADRSSFFIGLVIVDIFVGLADAISLPYIVLFLVDKAALSPLSLGAILTARAVSSIAFSAAFGGWIDKRTTLKPLVLALAGSSIGYGLLGFTTNFLSLMIIAALPIAIGAAAFSQSVALVKRCFDRSSPHTVNRAIGVMRASWSLAWAFGPMVGAVIVGAAGFRGAFLASGASGLAALAALAFVRAKALSREAVHAARPVQVTGGLTIGLAFAALVLFYTAMFLSQFAFPIVITTTLGGATSDVGIAMSVCAALEIVVMGAIIWRPLKRGERMAIGVGFAAFVIYCLTLALARSVGAVFWAQVPRAVAIGLVTYLGIGFLQSLMPHRAGAAAALFSNAGQLGSVLAALGVGGLAKAFGYTSIFAISAVLSAAGLAFVLLTPAEPNEPLSASLVWQPSKLRRNGELGGEQP